MAKNMHAPKREKVVCNALRVSLSCHASDNREKCTSDRVARGAASHGRRRVPEYNQHAKMVMRRVLLDVSQSSLSSMVKIISEEKCSKQWNCKSAHKVCATHWNENEDK